MSNEITNSVSNDYLLANVNALTKTIDKHEKRIYELEMGHHEGKANQLQGLYEFETRLKAHISTSLESSIERLSKADKEQDKKIQMFLERQEVVNEQLKLEIRQLQDKPMQDAYKRELTLREIAFTHISKHIINYLLGLLIIILSYAVFMNK